MSQSNVETLPFTGQRVGDVAANRLRSLVERIERLEEERKALGEDVKDVYTEAVAAGYNSKVVRKLIHERKQDPVEMELLDTLLETYRSALSE